MAFCVSGSRKDYAWGIVDGLADWTGLRDGSTQAELWFGVHPSGPAQLHGRSDLLSDHLSEQDAPLLVKLLAAAQPLSVQVHPDAARAAAAWRVQQEPGAPQVYADPWEKTEMLVALTEFTAFAGWRESAQAADLLTAIPGTEAARSALLAGDRRAAIRALLAVAPLGPAVQALERVAVDLPDIQRSAIKAAISAYPDDAGVLLLPLLAVEHLVPGDALYVPAGVPHSYVAGIGLEVMTSSDNVVRMGLTPKAVNIDEALAALRDDRAPLVLRGGDDLNPPGAPFGVALLRSGERIMDSGAYRVVVAIAGELQARVGSDPVLTVPMGAALVVTAEEPELLLQCDGLVALVRHA
jgi:mannose-6-phosphate isomerase